MRNRFEEIPIKKKLKYVLIITILIVYTVPFNVKAFVPYNSYTYDSKNKPVFCPDPYVPNNVIDGKILGTGEFSDPSDIFVSETGIGAGIYIVDTGNNRIIHCDTSFKIKKVIVSFEKDGRIESFNKPEGICVTQKGNIYISDTRNSRIVELDYNAKFVKEITFTSTLTDNFLFIPTKIAVNKFGIIYTLSRNTNEGILSFDQSGRFIAFTGANKTSVNLVDFFWKKISITEEKNRMMLFVPTEFNGIDIDDTDFLYTVTNNPGAGETPVRRLNPSGQDVLKQLGYAPPIGDLKYSALYGNKGPSTFVDVCAQKNGTYSCLDSKRGRIFTYDFQGYLLFVFGVNSISTQKGAFIQPVAIDSNGSKILVLDKNGSIQIFNQTEYGKLVLDADELLKSRVYNKAIVKWREVIKLNSNYSLAYSNIGKILFINGEYKKSLEYLRLGENREYYSEAFKKIRQEKIGNSLGLIVVFFIFILIVFKFYKKILKKKLEKLDYGLICKNIRHVFFTLIHPFKGFDEIKQGIKGHHGVSLSIIIVLIIVLLIEKRYLGFIFNFKDIERIRILNETTRVLIPLILWIISYWALQIFINGEATISHIINSTAIALMPIVLTFTISTIMSNFLIIQEGSILTVIRLFGFLWTIILLYVSISAINDFSAAKTLLTLVCNIGGMIAVLLLVFLFYNMVKNVFIFGYIVYNEIILK